MIKSPARFLKKNPFYKCLCDANHRRMSVRRVLAAANVSDANEKERTHAAKFIGVHKLGITIST